jgi:hypothetical protein
MVLCVELIGSIVLRGALADPYPAGWSPPLLIPPLSGIVLYCYSSIVYSTISLHGTIYGIGSMVRTSPVSIARSAG